MAISKIDKTFNPLENNFIDEESLSEVCRLTADFSGGIGSINDIAINMLHEKDKNLGFTGFNMDVNDIATGAAVTTLGVLNITRNKNTAKTSRKIGDAAGFFNNFIKMAVIGPAGIFAGVVDTAKSAVSLGSGEDKTPMMSNIIKGLGIASFVGNSTCSVVVGAVSIASVLEIGSIKKAFNQKIKEGGNAAAFNYLKEMLSVTPTEKKKILESLFKPKEKESWYKKAKTYIADAFLGEKESEEDKKIKEVFLKIPTNPGAISRLLSSLKVGIERKPLSKEEMKIEEYLREIFGDYKKLTPLKQKKLLQLVLQAYHKEVKHLKEKKAVIFKRVIGSETKELMEPLLKKNAEDIPAHKLKEIIASAKKGFFENTAVMSAIITACILNIVAGVIIQVVTGGFYFFIQLALNVVISAIWLGVDGYVLYQAYKEKHPDWKNKVLMALATLGMVVVSVIVSTLASSTSNLIVTATLTFAWLILILYGMYGRRKAYKEEGLRAAHA